MSKPVNCITKKPGHDKPGFLSKVTVELKQ